MTRGKISFKTIKEVEQEYQIQSSNNKMSKQTIAQFIIKNYIVYLGNYIPKNQTSLFGG